MKPASVLGEARARYIDDEKALEVGPDAAIPFDLARLSIDTLTLGFSGDEKVLVALDAYTHAPTWRRERLDVPALAHCGALQCLADFDEHGIAPGGDASLRYTYDETSATLLVSLCEGQRTTRFRCLTNVGCSLDERGYLLELWIFGVTRPANATAATTALPAGADEP